MESRGKLLLKNTMLFSIGNIGSKLLMLFIVPLYTYFVSVEQMGQYDVVNTYVGLFAPCACLALHEGVYRWLLDKNVLSENIIRIGVNFSLLFLLIFDIIATFVLSIMNYEYIVEFIVLVDSTAAYTFAQYATRGLKNNKIYAFQGIIYSFVLIITQVILVFWLRTQAQGLLISMAIAYTATTVYMLFAQRIVRKYYVNGKHDSSLVPVLIKYSLPIVFNNIAWWLVAAASRPIINGAMGDAANGIYAIALKFPTIVTMAQTFFYQAWQEQAISEYDSKYRDEYYSKVFSVYVQLLFTGVIVLLPVTKLIIVYFMQDSYQSASQYVGFLYLASVFNAFAAFYGTGYLSTKKTVSIITTTFAGAMVNIVITFLAIEAFGLYAAAIGNMLGYAIIWILRVIQTKKFFSIRLNIAKFSILIIMVFIFIYGITLINSFWLLTVAEVMAITVFVVANNREVSNMLRMVKKLNK